MPFSLCPRCGTNNFDSRNDHCYGCNYAGDFEGTTLPIPAWVMEHVQFLPWELREIRAVNLGLRPIRIPAGDAAEKRSTATVTDLPPRRRPRWRRSHRDFFPIIENGVVEI